MEKGEIYSYKIKDLTVSVCPTASVGVVRCEPHGPDVKRTQCFV